MLFPWRAPQRIIDLKLERMVNLIFGQTKMFIMIDNRDNNIQAQLEEIFGGTATGTESEYYVRFGRTFESSD